MGTKQISSRGNAISFYVQTPTWPKNRFSSEAPCYRDLHYDNEKYFPIKSS
jgi:hypothetical protein